MSAIRFSAAVCAALLIACTTRPRSTPPAPAQDPPPASPFLASARPLFEGCAAQAIGKGRDYACGDVESFIVELEDMDQESAMRISLKALRAIIADAGPEQRAEVVLAGRRWPMARIAACADGQPGSCQSGQVVWGDAPGGGARVVGCAVRNGAPTLAERCHRMLEYLVINGTPEGIPVAQASRPEEPKQLLDRALVIPTGCRLTEYSGTSGRLACEDRALFTWLTSSMTSRADLDAMVVKAVEGTQRAIGANGSEQTACRIEGVPTRCTVLEAGTGTERLRIYVGAAALGRERSLLATCGVPASRADPFPAACNGTFSLP